MDRPSYGKDQQKRKRKDTKSAKDSSPSSSESLGKREGKRVAREVQYAQEQRIARGEPSAEEQLTDIDHQLAQVEQRLQQQRMQRRPFYDPWGTFHQHELPERPDHSQLREERGIEHAKNVPELPYRIRVAHTSQLREGEGSEPGVHFSHPDGLYIYLPHQALTLNGRYYPYYSQIGKIMLEIQPGSISEDTRQNNVPQAVTTAVKNGVGKVAEWTLQYISDSNTGQSST